jgi:hypothetical protein
VPFTRPSLPSWHVHRLACRRGEALPVSLIENIEIEDPWLFGESEPAVVAVGAAALAPTAPALAHAPQVGKQAQPGFYRFKLGTIDITVVSDGTLAFPAETLWGDRAEDARGLLTSTFQPSSPVGLEINTLLVNTATSWC